MVTKMKEKIVERTKPCDKKSTTVEELVKNCSGVYHCKFDEGEGMVSVSTPRALGIMFCLWRGSKGKLKIVERFLIKRDSASQLAGYINFMLCQEPIPFSLNQTQKEGYVT